MGYYNNFDRQSLLFDPYKINILEKLSTFKPSKKIKTMKKLLILTLITMSVNTIVAQNVMSPELLWKLGRISPLGISKDEKNIIYKVSTPSVDENKSNSKYYSIPVNGGTAIEISEYKFLLADKNISPDGKYI